MQLIEPRPPTEQSYAGRWTTTVLLILAELVVYVTIWPMAVTSMKAHDNRSFMVMLVVCL